MGKTVLYLNINMCITELSSDDDDENYDYSGDINFDNINSCF